MFYWVRTDDLMNINTNVQAINNAQINISQFLQELSNVIIVNSSSLAIYSINGTEDGGSYTCLVINEAGVAREGTILYVSPVFTIQPMDILTLVEEPVTLTCFADSFPPPQYQWQMINRATGEFDELSGETSTSLVFSAIQFEEYGDYRCVVTTPTIDESIISNNVTITGEYVSIQKKLSRKIKQFE